MTDDIVTRLRKQVADHHCYWNGDRCRDCRNQNHAADEIERLRKDGDDLWFWIVHLREGNTWCGQREKQCDVCRNYEETLPND